MFKHIIHYDWLLLRRNRTLAVSVSLLALFTAFALWNGAQHVSFQHQTLTVIQDSSQKTYSALQAAVHEIEAGKPYTGNAFQNPQSPYPIGANKGARFATLAPEPLALIAFGQSDLLPYYYRVTMTKKQSLYHAEEIENAAILYNGNFDVAFVIVYLVPLLIITLSYNIVASEREQGTLAILLSSNARFDSLVLTKYLFRFALVGAAFSVVLIVGLLLARVNLVEAAPQLGLLLLTTLLYAVFWFALSFAVNSFGRNSGFNAAILVGAWLLLVLIIPATLSVIATTLHPTLSRVELITTTREASDSAKKRSSQLLSKFYEDHPDLLPKDKQVDAKDFAITALTAQMEVDKILKPFQNRYEVQLQAQQSLVRFYRVLSPALFVQHTLNDIAGTGHDHYASFNAQVVKFYTAFQQFFVEKIFRQEQMTSADFEQIPVFHYQKPDVPLLAWSNILNLSLLLALTVVCAGVGLRRTARLQLVYAVA